MRGYSAGADVEYTLCLIPSLAMKEKERGMDQSLFHFVSGVVNATLCSIHGNLTLD